MIERKSKASMNTHMDSITSGDYFIKVNANSTVVCVKNMADYQAVLRNLLCSQFPCHIYNRSGKNHAFVLRGLQTIQ